MVHPEDKPSVALAHHWLVSMRGGEKTLAALAQMFPDSPIYTLLVRANKLDPDLRHHTFKTSWLQRFQWIPRLQRKSLPVFFWAAHALDASAYQTVICSDAASIKAIRTSPESLKICYCHSPMRYVWDLYHTYYAEAGPVGKLGLRLFASRLRKADRRAADTVTAFVANSRHIAERIKRCYGRSCVVIPPPVPMNFSSGPASEEDFYLVVGEQVFYKRTDLAIEACHRLGKRLVIIGEGPQLNHLQKRSGTKVRILGWQDDATIRDHLRRCRALLFCGMEDFGLVPVEAQAAGKPVIAFRGGGVLDTVIEHRTGIFFDQQSVEHVMRAIQQFEACHSLWPASRIQEHARQFSADRFCDRFFKFYQWCQTLRNQSGVRAVRDAIEHTRPDAFL